MKLLIIACSLLFLGSSLRANPVDPAGPAKITKNEAEHIALKRFPGGRVQAAKLETVEGTLIWSLQVVQKEAQPAQTVAVDAKTGRIVEKKP